MYKHSTKQNLDVLYCTLEKKQQQHSLHVFYIFVYCVFGLTLRFQIGVDDRERKRLNILLYFYYVTNTSLYEL